MIIDCISDLHGHYPQLEGGDLLIVAGDLTARDTIEEYMEFLRWLKQQNYRKKIFIGGNHDNKLIGQWKNEGPFRKSEDKAFYDFDYLCDSGTEFEYEKWIEGHQCTKTLKIWGSPWTKTFEGMNPHCKAFTVDTEEELAEKFALIPKDVDILITHSPPYTILDKTTDGLQVGSSYLMGALIYCFRPKLWVFGHMHESYGQQSYKEMTMCVNASHVNEHYEPVNKPIRVII